MGLASQDQVVLKLVVRQPHSHCLPLIFLLARRFRQAQGQLICRCYLQGQKRLRFTTRRKTLNAWALESMEPFIDLGRIMQGDELWLFLRTQFIVQKAAF